MIDFDSMSAKAANAYLHEWVATSPERRQWLDQAMTSDGHPPLQEQSQSLEDVAVWLAERTRIRDGVQLGGRMPDLSDVDADQVPSWFDSTPAGAWMFDNWSNWAIDAAALNFAYVVTTLDPAITWVVARERTRGYIDQNRPCLRRSKGAVPLNPIAVHVGGLLRLHTQNTPPAASIDEALTALGLT